MDPAVLVRRLIDSIVAATLPMFLTMMVAFTLVQQAITKLQIIAFILTMEMDFLFSIIAIITKLQIIPFILTIIMVLRFPIQTL